VVSLLGVILSVVAGAGWPLTLLFAGLLPGAAGAWLGRGATLGTHQQWARLALVCVSCLCSIVALVALLLRW
jgi:hypothetical protein